MHQIADQTTPPSTRRAAVLRIAAVQLVGIGLAALALPIAPAVAQVNDYQTCANQLLETGIQPAQAATACARALRPQELSSCVVNINQQTEIDAIAALSTCRRVRRPDELSTCVVDIYGIDADAGVAAPLEILDSCRRSLLPTRFSACVVGLSNELELTRPTAMSTCLSGAETQLSTPPPGTAPNLLTPFF